MDLAKIESLEGGVQNFLLERRDKPVKGGGGVDVEMEGCHFFITLQLHNIYCVRVRKVKFPLLLFGSSAF